METCEKLELNNLTCRICLLNYDTSHSLYDVVEYDEKLELKDVLKRVTNVQIAADEAVAPTRICNDCTDKLLNAFDFVCKVDKSECKLREYLESEKKDTLFSEQQHKMVSYEYLDDNDSQIIEALDEEFQIVLYEDELSENELELKSIKVQSPKKDQAEVHLNSAKIFQDNSKAYSESKPRKSAQIMEKNTPLGKNQSHKCLKCLRSFAKVETLDRHIKVAHTYAPAEEIAAVVAMNPNAPKELFNCTHCPRTFARKDNLTRHIQNVHTVDHVQEKKPNTYKRGLCPYCGESFSQASLIVHIRRHTGETPYKCDECSKGFPRRQDLIIHQRKHTGERPHVCTVCGKTFARPNKLTRHMRIHTGERPYKCTKCDRSFAQSNDLTIHIRRHTGEKPYKCNVCADAFISGTALKTHCKLKSHGFVEDDVAVDPYEKIRVNNRGRVPYGHNTIQRIHSITQETNEELNVDDP